MLTFSQQDPRWAKQKLGKSNCTIGRYGCTTTDICMGYDWFYNSRMTPNQCAEKLNYTKDGLILWESLKNIKLKLISRLRYRNDKAIQDALKNPDLISILEVNSNHWLFLIGRKLPILGYKVVDPWDGKIKYTNAYRNNITGCAIISKL